MKNKFVRIINRCNVYKIHIAKQRKMIIFSITRMNEIFALENNERLKESKRRSNCYNTSKTRDKNVWQNKRSTCALHEDHTH